MQNKRSWQKISGYDQDRPRVTIETPDVVQIGHRENPD